MQNNLNSFHDYCNIWTPNVNVAKTKIIVFGSRKFRLGDKNIEITTYNYVGSTFSRKGSFIEARKNVAQQAKKAMFCVLSRINNADLQIDLARKLFDSTVLPILTYGSEIFGYENIDIIIKSHMISFWSRLIAGKTQKLSYQIHNFMLHQNHE